MYTGSIPVEASIFSFGKTAMIAGLILAGGGGQRLGGVRKAHLRLGNIPLVTWSAARLDRQVDALLLSVAENASEYADPDITVLPDSPDSVTGPAAGLAAGARWCAAINGFNLMISMAVDTPFFPHDFIERARPLLASGINCVMSSYKNRDFPTCALWRVPALHDVLASEQRTAKGPRLRDIASRIGVARCSYDDLPENPFAGINTLPDLLALSEAIRDGGKLRELGVGKRNQIG